MKHLRPRVQQNIQARQRAIYWVFSEGGSILYSGRDDDQHRGGVGLILSKGMKQALIEWLPISKWLMIGRFKTKVRNLTVIQCYAPTEVADEEDKDAFYQRLNETLERTKRKDVIILMGDLNAQNGSANKGMEHVLGKES
ncbi:Craniofacial development protein 2 [Zootermopsis nevadensis]|uniref:Craniofacial development protein 2 n=1 Tax=Zootermopsis nevadensis TaxID=136037 RepID=A0A067RFG9_ZOONE|nr:Craniofacial development protein 2 [Zootermopsis nevadensis]